MVSMSARQLERQRRLVDRATSPGRRRQRCRPPALLPMAISAAYSEGLRNAPFENTRDYNLHLVPDDDLMVMGHCSSVGGDPILR